jgi:hypothetical protein
MAWRKAPRARPGGTYRRKSLYLPAVAGCVAATPKRAMVRVRELGPALSAGVSLIETDARREFDLSPLGANCVRSRYNLFLKSFRIQSLRLGRYNARPSTC